MRLVIEYSEGDGYTYCCTNTFPIEYESAEQLLVDIEHACAEYLLKEKERNAACPEHPKHKQTEDQYFEKMAEWHDKYPCDLRNGDNSSLSTVPINGVLFFKNV